MQERTPSSSIIFYYSATHGCAAHKAHLLRPPFAMMTWPVTHVFSAEVRKYTTLAMSSTVPKRPARVQSQRERIRTEGGRTGGDLAHARDQHVGVGEAGLTLLTETLRGPSSFDSTTASVSMAALDAEYTLVPGKLTDVTTEEMTTMWPPSCTRLADSDRT